MKIEIVPAGHISSVDRSEGNSILLGDNGSLPGIIAQTFGWESIRIDVEHDDGSRENFGACRKGKKVVLLPMFSYGPNVETATAKCILKFLRSQGFHTEWRLTKVVSEFIYADKITTLLELENNGQLQFSKFKPNVRRKIRKSRSNGITVKPGKKEMLKGFFDVYARNMHRLGSPALPARWFANLLKNFSEGEALIWCALYKNEIAGVAFMLENNGFYEACWFSTLKKYNRLYTSYGLYWAMIEHAIMKGGRVFSFGRSTLDSSVHKYKQHWGGRDIQLFWNYSHPQPVNIRQLVILNKVWKSIPYYLAKKIGPVISGRFY